MEFIGVFFAIFVTSQLCSSSKDYRKRFSFTFTCLRKWYRKNALGMSNWGDKRLRGRGIIALQSFFSLAVVLWQIDLKHKREERMKGKPEAVTSSNNSLLKAFFYAFLFFFLLAPRAIMFEQRFSIFAFFYQLFNIFIVRLFVILFGMFFLYYL